MKGVETIGTKNFFLNACVRLCEHTDGPGVRVLARIQRPEDGVLALSSLSVLLFETGTQPGAHFIEHISHWTCTASSLVQYTL